MKVIILTGSVGAGKTTLAKKLAKKLDYRYIDANKVIKDYGLSERYDRERKCRVVDVKKLNNALVNEINKYKKLFENGVIIDSHLSHYLPRRYVDLCIVVKCDLKVLERRLKKRRYNKKKVKENIECEIFDICFNEAKKAKHKVIVINTSKIPQRGIFDAFETKVFQKLQKV